MLCFFYKINFPSLIHGILSGTGETSEEIFGWLKEYFKVLLFAPQPAQWGARELCYCYKPNRCQRSPLGTCGHFFFNGVSLIFENYKLLS